jgi:hypothetical protein
MIENIPQDYFQNSILNNRILSFYWYKINLKLLHLSQNLITTFFQNLKIKFPEPPTGVWGTVGFE